MASRGSVLCLVRVRVRARARVRVRVRVRASVRVRVRVQVPRGGDAPYSVPLARHLGVRGIC